MWLQLGATSFRFYIKPQDPGAPLLAHASGVSLAGQGMGLQVFPGNLTEVVQVRGCVYKQLRSGAARGFDPQ